MNLKGLMRSILILLIILLLKNFNTVIHIVPHILTNGDDVFFSTPNAFHFKIMTSDDRGDLFEEYDADYNEIENTYYYHIPSKYLNNDDVQVYVTGDLWCCLAKPHIKVNGVTNDTVYVENSAYKSSYSWSHKLYHFYHYDTILPNFEYKFYVRCHDYSESSTVVFLPE